MISDVLTDRYRRAVQRIVRWCSVGGPFGKVVKEDGQALRPQLEMIQRLQGRGAVRHFMSNLSARALVIHTLLGSFACAIPYPRGGNGAQGDSRLEQEGGRGGVVGDDKVDKNVVTVEDYLACLAGQPGVRGLVERRERTDHCRQMS